PQFQLGSACLVDQLVGQFLAHICGLGHLTDDGHQRATLASVYRHNFRALTGHFNHMRSYAMPDETGVLMATYPRGKRPKWPFPYFSEVMTGFEYTAAVHMLYEGMRDEGLAIIAAIRARYDGRRRNPFDEAECGHHYARAMASWAAILALTGFHYSGVTGAMRFAPLAGTNFWSAGNAWGEVSQRETPDGIAVTLTVRGGALSLRRVALTGRGEAAVSPPASLRAGDAVTVTVPSAG
ncbi:MAG TPA: GH116 family glycosyl hydrolase, partial [Armatimonadota bacterium]|nr:GH116 family glycosyl hydrolase [Armatimonadota bacterium]